MSTVYLSLGSNLGDRLKYIHKAINLIRKLPYTKVQKTSRIYETEPREVKNQPWFLNCILRIETTLPPRRLLEELKNIESKLGRKGKMGSPREIDVDIVLYDKLRVEEEDLKIPHKKMHERAFVLVPLVEVAPEVVHPVYGKTASELLHEAKGKIYLEKVSPYDSLDGT
jgi:2-amino-4-hydroxy-6-hydroxymethyldihydropteridine diphosphokinase